MGSGGREYGYEVSILSGPQRRFGDFAAAGKVTRRPGYAPIEQKPTFGGEIGSTPGRRAEPSHPAKETGKNNRPVSQKLLLTFLSKKSRRGSLGAPPAVAVQNFNAFKIQKGVFP